MVNSDYNLTEPVETFKNVENVNAAKLREDRKKRRNNGEQNKKPRPQPAKDDLIESADENAAREIAENDCDGHSIDYCA